MKLAIALKLGRVSNLPTVGTNALAGFLLAGQAGMDASILPVLIGAVLAYTAGMFLNDAFDAEFDASHQPFRPIPSGQVPRTEVFVWGFGMLAASIACFAASGWAAGAAGLGLAALIVIYNRHHKGNPFGPVLMGLCRLQLYLAAGLAANGTLGVAFWTGAVLLMLHVMGLTFIAKSEHGPAAGRYLPHAAVTVAPLVGALLAFGQVLLWPFVAALAVADTVALRLAAAPRPNYGRIIPMLIAAIPLLDAVMIARLGLVGPALLACAAFPLTLWLQRWVRGT